MQTADREEFETQLAKLCAGYNLPVTTHRKDAYWSGLAKMSLAQFARCIDFALSADGPDDMPTVKGIWRLHRELHRARTFVQAEAPIDGRDHLEYWANRLLYAHLASRGGLGSTGKGEDAQGSPELIACMKLKRELVAWFVGPIREGDVDATPAEFLRQWIAGLQEISRIETDTARRWAAMVEDPEFAKPFRPEMGRELRAQHEQRSLVPA